MGLWTCQVEGTPQRGLAGVVSCSQPPPAATNVSLLYSCLGWSSWRWAQPCKCFGIHLRFNGSVRWKMTVKCGWWSEDGNRQMLVNMSRHTGWLTRQEWEASVTKLGFIDLFSLQSQLLLRQISNHSPISYFQIVTTLNKHHFQCVKFPGHVNLAMESLIMGYLSEWGQSGLITRTKCQMSRS